MSLPKNMNTPFETETALVTGANRGIGHAIAHELLARGVKKLYAAARNPATLAPLVAAFPGRVVTVTLDVTDPAQVAAAAESAQDVTIVVNNAGYLGAEDMLTGEVESFRREFEVNYWGPLHVTRAFAPVLKTNGGGTLVNLASVAGLSNFPSVPTYSDSKAAVHSLTVGTRFLLAAQGTKVIGVYPGPVDTEMARDLPMDKFPPSAVATAIVEAIENGTEDVFTDPFAESYRASYEAGPKVLEKRITEALSQPA